MIQKFASVILHASSSTKDALSLARVWLDLRFVARSFSKRQRATHNVIFLVSCHFLIRQPRGPKEHLKRGNAPMYWMLDKMGGVFAPRQSAAPHFASVPLSSFFCETVLSATVTVRRCLILQMLLLDVKSPKF